MISIVGLFSNIAGDNLYFLRNGNAYYNSIESPYIGP